MSYERTTEPTTIQQGESVRWTRTIDDYPADLYTLEYRFRGLRGTGSGFNITATADGDAFDAVISTTNSAAMSVTRYGWQAWLTEIADSTNVFCIDDGETAVTAGFTHGSTTAADTRSAAKIALDAINAAISGQATANVLEYEISTGAGTRRIKRMDMNQLLAARKEYSALVAAENAREQIRRGGTFGKPVKVRMYDNG